MPRKVLLVVTLFAALACGTATAGAGVEPRFKPFVGYDQGACGEKGMRVFVSVILPDGTTTAQANAVERRYVPRGKGALEVGGRRYELRHDPKDGDVSASGGYWGFDVIRIGKQAGLALVGKKARITYPSRAGTMTSKTKVAIAGCG